MMINLQMIANYLLVILLTLKENKKSYILIANALIQIDALIRQSIYYITNKFGTYQKHDKLVVSSIRILKREATNEQNNLIEK